MGPVSTCSGQQMQFGSLSDGDKNPDFKAAKPSLFSAGEDQLLFFAPPVAEMFVVGTQITYLQEIS
jgi:hypothetical protein